MNKEQLIEAVISKTESKRSDVERTLKAFWQVIEETLAKSEKITLVGIGTFGTKERKERTGQNPKTGQKLTIAAATLPYFKPGSKLKLAAAKASDKR